jgi:hypothetical protein
MISKLFLATGTVIAAAADAGSMETIKNVLLIAFLAVGIIWLLIDARRNLIATYGGAVAPAPQTAASASPARTPASAPAPAGQPSPEILAVIAAAVHTTLGRSAQIVSVSTDEEENEALTWAAEGRRAIYATRKVR